MVKKHIVILAGLAALAVVSGISSCEKYTLPSVSFEKDTLFVDMSGGVYNVGLNCTVAWTIDNPYAAEWSAIEPVRGNGDAVLSIEAKANGSNAPRTATYTVKTECIEKKLTVIQQPK